MFAQNWIESLNMIFGTETNGTAIIVSLLTLVSITVLIIFTASKNRRLFEIVTIVDFLGSLILVFFEWLPSFTGLVIAAIFALLGAWILTGGRN